MSGRTERRGRIARGLAAGALALALAAGAPVGTVALAARAPVGTVALAARAPVGTVALAQGAADELARFTTEVERGKVPLDDAALARFRDLLRVASEEALLAPAPEPAPDATRDPAAPPRALDAQLVDLCGLFLDGRRRPFEPGPAAEKVRAEVRRALDGRIAGPHGADVARWLTDVPLQDTKRSAASRSAVARALSAARFADALPPLLAAAQARKPEELREAVQDGLVGWRAPEVTDFLLTGCDLVANEGIVPFDRLKQHVETVGPEADGEQQYALVERIAPHLTGEWREAARALWLLRPLPTQELYPVLIDALERWAALPPERGSKRIECDLAEELERRSGRVMGPRPERWRAWWDLVRAGKAPPPPEPDELDDRSVATFFSLRPSSRRVTFVVDRSGSMTAEFGSQGALRTRWEEAISQMLGYLRASGPETRFNVLLFGNETERWKSRLQDATERNLEGVEKWMRYYAPNGGTHLREAVELALELGRDGDAELSRLESDTIVVLCDGVTHGGPDWVAPTLKRINGTAQIVFHCVQIGTEGDGTLEALALGTGGDYIRVVR